jgi:hypothetical protein
MEQPYALDFLLVEGGEGWYARCLEYDFVTQADTLEGLYHEIQRTVSGHLGISSQLGRPPFEGLAPADRKCWEMFEKAELVLRPRTARVGATAPNLPPHELRELRVAVLT